MSQQYNDKNGNMLPHPPHDVNPKRSILIFEHIKGHIFHGMLKNTQILLTSICNEFLRDNTMYFIHLIRCPDNESSKISRLLSALNTIHNVFIADGKKFNHCVNVFNWMMPELSNEFQYQNMNWILAKKSLPLGLNQSCIDMSGRVPPLLLVCIVIYWSW